IGNLLLRGCMWPFDDGGARGARVTLARPTCVLLRACERPHSASDGTRYGPLCPTVERASRDRNRSSCDLRRSEPHPPPTTSASRRPLAHALHELAHLFVVLHQPVDVLDRRARASGDPLPPAGVEEAWSVARLLGHARDDPFDAADLLVVDVRPWRDELVGAGDHLDDVTERADLLDLAHLREHVLQGEIVDAAHLGLV